MQDGVRELIDRRMKRALAAILGMKEREVDPFLPEHVAAKLRRVVLAEMNDLVEVIVDVVDSVDDESVTINEYWINMIEQIHQATVQPSEWAGT